MKKYLIVLMVLISGTFAFAAEPDMLVTQDGKSLKVYNLDYSSADFCYYTIEPNSDDVNRIKKSEVLIIKKADGSKVDPNKLIEKTSAVTTAAPNPSSHKPVTFTANVEDFVEIEKKGKKDQPTTIEKTIIAGDGVHPKINFRIISDEENTLAVTKFGKNSEDHKYLKKNIVDCVIPEYVKIGSDIYSVIEVDDAALSDCKFKHLQFPSTLKRIGHDSFIRCVKLKKIIIPDGVETIGDMAFFFCGSKDFSEIYIPKSVKEIGSHAFWRVGYDLSPNGHYKGYLSCIPDWVTPGNCSRFNIDNSAVEEFIKRDNKNQ